MEAVTIAGVAVVVVGGFYWAVDFLNDFGIHVKMPQSEKKRLSFPRRSLLPAQRRVKKMPGMHV